MNMEEFKKKIITDYNRYKNQYEEFDENKKKLIKGLNVKKNSIIDVHDYGICRVIDKKENATAVAILVIEEDGSVNWYRHPDSNSDFSIYSVWCKKIRER